ncbi:MAG TPA: hypothetical protein VLQ65_07955 [Saliniramus sp.]|nr:hypothetical protein [Saliniramus sp.]
MRRRGALSRVDLASISRPTTRLTRTASGKLLPFPALRLFGRARATPAKPRASVATRALRPGAAGRSTLIRPAGVRLAARANSEPPSASSRSWPARTSFSTPAGLCAKHSQTALAVLGHGHAGRACRRQCRGPSAGERL